MDVLIKVTLPSLGHGEGQGEMESVLGEPLVMDTGRMEKRWFPHQTLRNGEERGGIDRVINASFQCAPLRQEMSKQPLPGMACQVIQTNTCAGNKTQSTQTVACRHTPTWPPCVQTQTHAHLGALGELTSGEEALDRTRSPDGWSWSSGLLGSLGNVLIPGEWRRCRVAAMHSCAYVLS